MPGEGSGARGRRQALALRGDSGTATVGAEAEALEQVGGGREPGRAAGSGQLVPSWGSAQSGCVLYVFLDDMFPQVFSHFLALKHWPESPVPC